MCRKLCYKFTYILLHLFPASKQGKQGLKTFTSYELTPPRDDECQINASDTKRTQMLPNNTNRSNLQFDEKLTI